MDAATLAALGQEIVYVQWFAWIDVVGDPLRAVSGVQSIAFGAGETGDADLDGNTFIAIPGDLVDVGDVQHAEDGSNTVTAKLSGLPEGNADMLALLGDKSKWRKREARLWFRLLEPATFGNGGQPVTFTPLPIQRYYSGYLVGLRVENNDGEQVLVATIENYQAALSEASGLTYLHQNEFDAGDNSAAQTLAAANGMEKAGVRGGGSGGGGRGGGGVWRDVVRQIAH